MISLAPDGWIGVPSLLLCGVLIIPIADNSISPMDITFLPFHEKLETHSIDGETTSIKQSELVLKIIKRQASPGNALRDSYTLDATTATSSRYSDLPVSHVDARVTVYP